MYFVAPNELVHGGKPIFLGLVKEGFLDPCTSEFTEALPLLRTEVKSISYSVFKLGIDAKNVASMSLVMNPLEEFQNVPIETTAIIPLGFVKDWVYATMKVPKFEVNFVFVPKNTPPIFETSGTYVIRFEITDNNKEVHPTEVQITVSTPRLGTT